MEFELVIKNGNIITSTETTTADIGINKGKIVRVGIGLSGQNELDANGYYVIPGGIDPHVHLAMDAGSIRTTDDFRSGSIAAAFGGTTTFIDFVEPEQEETLSEALAKRRAQADGQTILDYGLHMTITNDAPDTLAEIPNIIQQGVRSFKTYLTYPGFMLNDEQLIRVLTAVTRSNGMTLCHAENRAAIEFLRKKMLDMGRRDPINHALSRPAATEIEAVTRVIALAEAAQAPLYVVHVSTAGGARAVHEGRERGVQVWGETCPQYLLLTQEMLEKADFEGAKYVCSPPLRSSIDNQALWQALSEGWLTSIGTDHCPFNFSGQKDLGREDFTKIPGGMPGIEPRMSLIYEHGVRSKRITINQWVDLCSTHPARIFGLYPRKGSLQPGADADIVIFDPNAKMVISPETLHENVDYTPYNGFSVTGLPMTVLQRGRVLIQNRELATEPGVGQFIYR